MDQPDKKAQAQSSSGRRRRRPAGPPPRLAWGGGGVGVASFGSGAPRSTGPTPLSSGSSSPPPAGAELGGVQEGGGGGSGSGSGSGGRSVSFRVPTAPGSGAGTDQSQSSSAAAATERNSKRAKKSGGSTGGTSTNVSVRGRKRDGVPTAAAAARVDPSSMLWVDKHAPTDDPSALCVAPKKVKEFREWMVRSSSSTAGVGLGGGSTVDPRLLILVGSPGIGKSTMVRVLSAELGITVHEWNDAHHQPHNPQRGIGSVDYDSLLAVRYQGPLASFEEFLGSAGTGFSALNVTGTSASPSLSSSSLATKKKAKGNKSGKKTPPAQGQRVSRGGALILIEEMPNLHTPESAEKFRTLMTQHIRRSQTPTVLIFSDVCEGKHRPADLERLVDPSVLYSPLVRITQIHAVAKPKMRKCLQVIAKAERLDVPDVLWEELHASSGGDFRHAVMALQFQYAVDGRGDRAGGGKRGGVPKGSRDRDTKLSTFHALGKLLYAKRQKVNVGAAAISSSTSAYGSTQWNDGRSPLEFVPEDVMNQSDIEQGGAVSFLAYHSPDFFTDETELCRAFELFSDASLFIDREFSSQRDRNDSIFPLEYVSSIAGRAVADANKHPAPNRFRQLNAPKIFEVMRKKRGNDVKMLQLCGRLSRGSGFLPLEANIGPSDRFVVDTLPYLRTIAPREVDYALANLHSYARPEEKTAAGSEPVGDLLRKEQRLILEGDDIVDDDDDSLENVPNGNANVAMDTNKAKSQKSTSVASHHPDVIVID